MEILPDLTPWASQDKGYIYNWTVQNNELRLTSAIANIGAGAMELRGGATHNDVQDVVQRIYNDDGSYNDVSAGEFIHHPTHGHIHFEDFAEYRIREINADGTAGAIVATGEKVSFCLIDVDRYDSSGDARAYRTCGQVQGISSGWADVYSQGLPGQSINIANVSNGNYFLEVIVDPEDLLRESDETNNVTRIPITLDRDGGPPPNNGDNFEANDSFEAASILTPPEDHLYENLSVHTPNNRDYYRVTATSDGTLSFNMNFQHAGGNLDMIVYDANRNELSRSVSSTDNESVSIEVNTGEVFYIEIFGNSGATNENYSLFVDQPSTGTGPNDVIDTPNVTEYLTGTTADNDTFVIAGDATDYGWGPTEDGASIVVWGPTGHDILTGFEAIRFNDTSVSLVQTGNEYQDVANVTQYITGTSAEETFVINGSSGDYNWGATEDGSGFVVWGPTGFDLLYNIEKIAFADQTVTLDDPGNSNTVQDDPNTTQFVYGNANTTDKFVINDNASEFGWGATDDGQGVVVWNNATGAHDLLYDVEELVFNDQTVNIDQVA